MLWAKQLFLIPASNTFYLDDPEVTRRSGVRMSHEVRYFHEARRVYTTHNGTEDRGKDGESPNTCYSVPKQSRL
jgi:hypothetical protein